MIKQELIGILEGLEGDSFIEKYNEGYDQAVRACLIAVKQLDESKKVVVPKFVAKKIEAYGSAIEMLANEYFDQSSEEVDSDKLACWIDENADMFLKAWVCGYEVAE